MAISDVSVERIQNRRGLKINLPQPLRPGEYGFCTDTRELFIGIDPEQMNAPAIQIYSGQVNVADTIMTNQIVIGDTNTVPTDTNISDLNTALGINPLTDSAEGNVYYIPETGLLYVGGDLAQIGDISATVTAQPWVDSVTTDLNKTIDANGGVLFTYHSEANAVAAILNGVSNDPVATTKLNIEILTEESDLDGSEILDPVVTTLPSVLGFTSIPELVYEAEETETFVIDYSIHVYDTLDIPSPTQSSYVSSGSMTITTNVHTQESLLNEESTVIADAGWSDGGVDFQAVFTPGGSPLTGTVEIQYFHSIPVSPTKEVVFKTNTKRWSSF
jgi:hypothetical protein